MLGAIVSWMNLMVLGALPSASPAPIRQTCVTAGCHPQVMQGKYIHGPMKAKGCGICHRKGEGYDDLPKDHPHLKPIRKEEINTSCLVCHDDDIYSNARFAHKVIDEKACVECHDPHRSNKLHLLKDKEVPELCVSCHEDIEKHARLDIKHGAMTTKKTCLNCHVAHHSNQKGLLRERQSAVCLDCHSKEVTATDKRQISNIGEVLKKNTFKHKPILEEKCVDCHNVHGAKHSSLLKKPYTQKFHATYDPMLYDLCFECHESTLASSRLTESDTKFRNGRVNLHFTHLNADKGRTCRTCHEVHAAENALLVSSWTPYLGVELQLKFKASASGGTCATACHGEKSYDREKEVKNHEGR